MGNNDIGRQIGIAVQAVYDRRRPDDIAIYILDQFCMGRIGRDADWEAEDPKNPGHQHPKFGRYTDPTPEAGLGMLMVEAFSPNGLEDLELYHGELGYKPTGIPEQDKELQRLADASSELWWEQVYKPFKERYLFW